MGTRPTESVDSINETRKRHRYSGVHDFFVAACWHGKGQHACNEDVIRRDVALFEGPAKVIPDYVVTFVRHLTSQERKKRHERRLKKETPGYNAVPAS